MASYNDYCAMLFSFPGIEVKNIPIHSEISVKEIPLNSFTNFLSYYREQSSHPQRHHLFCVISPYTHPKTFNIFSDLVIGSK